MLNLLFLAAAGLAQPEIKTYTIDGVEREAAIYAPAKTSAHPPLVFGFHGHGGNMRNAARSFRMHEEMPEAVVVYMQGLPTSTKNDPRGNRPGWQNTTLLGQHRDIDFFDAVYSDVVKRFQVDVRSVFCMGHSNGGRFSYLLWSERGERFRAFAPSGSPATGLDLKSKPVFHVVGEKDPLVDPDNQKATIERLKTLNGCSDKGTGYGSYATRYLGKNGNDVVAYVHPGGHEYPRDVPPLVAKFFRTTMGK